MNLRKVAIAKNCGYRTTSFTVPEWKSEVFVREPLHLDFARYIKTIESINENKKTSVREKDILKIKAEAELFASVYIDEKGDPVFNKDVDIESLVKNYGPIHTRIVNKSIDLIGLSEKPIEEAEKK
ncbi:MULTISPECIES: phage tail assembly chaperone [unclassified Gilliamella]|uniref:phage tail assembly chaperone n=1 Tax=unclassified Gilliamella TaxID=2685620 RepID=UPI00226A71F1|nr:MULTISPECIES: phage tail assembly chaperone [unclassified Gilliamella]MCX8585153.1 hypothetical protein [Gilliamella sp. B3562]MCX8597214.1 hypothetical protein [Gilliamella sp. B3493]MCX8598570.1 hypothetical protein [Gilliamella sp. B3486]MCX8675947.1 hypothetical protein [Gilliamella sp. B3023]MCX8685181.1 hypothetical protein [Gilliamella sp. B2864]